MLSPSRNRMTAKRIANRKCPVPNEGGGLGCGLSMIHSNHVVYCSESTYKTQNFVRTASWKLISASVQWEITILKKIDAVCAKRNNDLKARNVSYRSFRFRRYFHVILASPKGKVRASKAPARVVSSGVNEFLMDLAP
jgi:hypothetical protein